MLYYWIVTIRVDREHIVNRMELNFDSFILILITSFVTTIVCIYIWYTYYPASYHSFFVGSHK